jgi:hypothetical protein
MKISLSHRNILIFIYERLSIEKPMIGVVEEKKLSSSIISSLIFYGRRVHTNSSVNVGELIVKNSMSSCQLCL